MWELVYRLCTPFMFELCQMQLENFICAFKVNSSGNLKNNVRMVRDIIQSYCVILGIFFVPPYIVSMWYMRPLYTIPSLPWSSSAFFSCSPMHRRYAFLGRKPQGQRVCEVAGLLRLLCNLVVRILFFEFL